MPDPDPLNDLLGKQGQTDPQQNQQTQLGDLRSLVQSPEEDFMMTLMEFLDGSDELDEAFSGGAAVEEELDDTTPPDPLAAMSMEEIELLMQKFEAMPSEAQQSVLGELKKDPVLYNQVMAAIRLVRGSDVQKAY
jgi:hypothetical protein